MKHLFIALSSVLFLSLHPVFAAGASVSSNVQHTEDEEIQGKWPAEVSEALERECGDDRGCIREQVQELKMMVEMFALKSEAYRRMLDALMPQSDDDDDGGAMIPIHTKRALPGGHVAPLKG